MGQIKNQCAVDQFSELDIRVGNVCKAERATGLRKPALWLHIDFGIGIGILKSSAQITELYDPEKLMGTQVVAVVNFPPRQIGSFLSQCLVLGCYTNDGVVLLRPDHSVHSGAVIG